MNYQQLSERIWQRRMDRRDFLWLASVSTAGVAVSSLTGCATDPVTGKSSLVLMSEQQEIALDKQQSPHQFSADYGVVQDAALNRYVSDIGTRMGKLSHRPQMPYNPQVVNATYVNAYTFPGGSMATTRGILLEMQSEDELAALLGHEIGHVNARHTAERATRSTLAGIAVAGVGVVAASSEKTRGYAGAITSLGGIGAGALLASYSRENEREADALGMEYMVRSDYNPEGMVDLMDMLNNMSNHKPNAIEQMFSSHPMSAERYQTAKNRTRQQYAGELGKAIKRERYMDNTARLRKQKAGIEQLQQAEGQMAKKAYPAAEKHYRQALKTIPDDYCALVQMGKCQLAQDKPKEAEGYLAKAREVYPQEAQAMHMHGIASLAQKKYQRAYDDFVAYERKLPGNPSTVFLQGISLESLKQQDKAAQQYQRFLRQVQQGEQAQYAYNRLVSWGYIQK